MLMLAVVFAAHPSDCHYPSSKRTTNVLWNQVAETVAHASVVCSGSIRQNLDPFEENSDEAIWKALEHVQLKEVGSGIAMFSAFDMHICARDNSTSSLPFQCRYLFGMLTWSLPSRSPAAGSGDG